MIIIPRSLIIIIRWCSIYVVRATQTEIAIFATKSNFIVSHNRCPFAIIYRILKIRDSVTFCSCCNIKLLLRICLKGDVWEIFCFTINNSLTRSPIFHGNTGNGNLVLTYGELIGIALSGFESRDASQRFLYIVCSYFKRKELFSGFGFARHHQGIVCVIALLIRFYITIDGYAINFCAFCILVVKLNNLYNHSRHFALHSEFETIVTWIFYIASKAHIVCGNKRSLIGIWFRLG